MPRFATDKEEVLVSLPHALSLTNAAYAFLKDGNVEAALKVQGILIGYLRGDKNE